MAPVLRQIVSLFAILVVGSHLAFGQEEAGKDAKAKPASEKIVGYWEGTLSIDDESLKKFMKDNNLPENFAPMIKKRMESGKFYFSFQKDGTGKAGIQAGGRLRLNEITWKVEKEEGNHAVIVITDDKKEDGKLDATFQKDGQVVATLIPPKKLQGKAPDLTVTMKEIEKLPEEAKPAATESPKTEKPTAKPE